MGRMIYEKLREEYQDLFDTCKIHQDKERDLDRIIARMERYRGSYQRIEDRLGIPWYFIAVIHERESSCRFDRHLHNGDPLTAPTVRHPVGRPPRGGPYFTWEESAADALKLKDLDDWTDWSIPGLLYQWESYNGFGYRIYHSDTLSPYLWSFSSHYHGGKYDYDGHFDPGLVDQQAGAASLLRRMVDLHKDYVAALCPDIEPTPLPPETEETTGPVTYIVQSGDTLSKIAKKFGLASWRVLWKANRGDIPNPNLIHVGQELVIPDIKPPSPPDPGLVSETEDYIIREGDTLTQIAKFYDITLGELFRLNPELIKPGTVIQVPKLSEEDDNIHGTLVPGQERLWLEIAEREIGMAELSPGENSRIIDYLRTTSYPDPRADEIPWCAAFVNWCIGQAKLKPRGSARARDWLDWGIEVAEPQPGCVVVIRTSRGHHVGFFVDADDKYIHLLGGNQSNAVNIQRYSRSKVLGYRWPREVSV